LISAGLAAVHAAASAVNDGNAIQPAVRKVLRELVVSRTSDDDEQQQVLRVLERWFVLGKTTAVVIDE